MESIKTITENNNFNTMAQKISNLNPLEKTESFVSLPTPVSSSMSWQSWALRFFLLFVILALLGINAWAYLSKGTDIFSGKMRKIVSSGSKGIFETIELTFTNFISGTRFSGGILANTFKDSLNLIKAIFTKLDKNETATIKQDKPLKESDLTKTLKGNKKKKGVVAMDDSESNIQEKKGGYCYIGHQTPHNACIEVDDVGKCLSGKIFKANEECKEYIPQ